MEKVKNLKEKIVICPECGKFMHKVAGTNVLSCSCGNYKLT